MNMSSILPFVFVPIFIVIFIFIIYANFSKKGKNKAIDFMFGEVIKDYGPLKVQTLRMGMTQGTRLLHCRKDDEDFLVLETTDKMPGSIQTTWTKIDDDMLRSINAIAKAH